MREVFRMRAQKLNGGEWGQRMLQDLMERYGTSETELEEQQIDDILDLISSEVRDLARQPSARLASQFPPPPPRPSSR